MDQAEMQNKHYKQYEAHPQCWITCKKSLNKNFYPQGRTALIGNNQNQQNNEEENIE